MRATIPDWKFRGKYQKYGTGIGIHYQYYYRYRYHYRYQILELQGARRGYR